MEYATFSKTLGQQARAARERLGLTQAQVAQQLDLVPDILGHIERGQMVPSVLTLRRLALVLGLSTDVLLALTPADVAPWVDEPTPELKQVPELRRTLRMLRGWSPGKVKMLNRALALIERTTGKD
jgi:transcriptional regulator with XRE-family HTH domain